MDTGMESADFNWTMGVERYGRTHRDSRTSLDFYASKRRSFSGKHDTMGFKIYHESLVIQFESLVTNLHRSAVSVKKITELN